MKRHYSSGQGYIDQITNLLTRVFFRSKPAHTKPLSSSRPKSRDSIHSMIGLECLEDRPVLVLSRSDTLAQASDWIVDAGFWVAHSQSIKQEFQSLRPDPQKWLVVLIAIDDFGGITNVLEDLLQLRRRIPGLPVILLSSEVHDDDFSSVRKHICDATLRLPLSLPRLNLALCESLINNAEWVGFAMQSHVSPADRLFHGFTRYEA